MTVALQEPVLVRDPAARHALPDLETLGQATFELESHGGYARTVTGKVAYFDEQAETYLVLEPAGTMARVPVRDIVSSRVASTGEPDRRPRRDDEGLGTGQD